MYKIHGAINYMHFIIDFIAHFYYACETFVSRMENEIAKCIKSIISKYGDKYTSIFNDLVDDLKEVLKIIFASFNVKEFMESPKPIEFFKKFVKDFFNKLDNFIEILDKESIKAYDDVHKRFQNIYKGKITTKQSKGFAKIRQSYSAVKIAFDKLDIKIIIPFIQLCISYVSRICSIIHTIYDAISKSQMNLSKRETVLEMFKRKNPKFVQFFGTETMLMSMSDIKLIDREPLKHPNVIHALKPMEIELINTHLDQIHTFVNKSYKGVAKTALLSLCFRDAFDTDWGKLILKLYDESPFSLTYELFDEEFIENIIIMYIFLSRARLELSDYLRS